MVHTSHPNISDTIFFDVHSYKSDSLQIIRQRRIDKLYWLSLCSVFGDQPSCALDPLIALLLIKRVDICPSNLHLPLTELHQSPYLLNLGPIGDKQDPTSQSSQYRKHCQDSEKLLHAERQSSATAEKRSIAAGCGFKPGRSIRGQSRGGGSAGATGSTW